MVREQLASYWSVILLSAGGLALTISAAVPDLVALLGRSSSPGAYPIRIELPKPALAARRTATFGDRTSPGLVTVLTDDVLPEVADARALAATQPAVPSTPTEQPAAQFGGLLTVNFDLADPAGSGDVQRGTGTLDARKGVRVNGVDVGAAAIRISPTSALFIARDEFRNLLSASDKADLAAKVGGGADGYASFDEIRRLGFNIRYDPVTDRILVSS